MLRTTMPKIRWNRTNCCTHRSRFRCSSCNNYSNCSSARSSRRARLRRRWCRAGAPRMVRPRSHRLTRRSCRWCASIRRAGWCSTTRVAWRSSHVIHAAGIWNGACRRDISKKAKRRSRRPCAKCMRKPAFWARWSIPSPPSTIGSPVPANACTSWCTTSRCGRSAASWPSKAIPTMRPKTPFGWILLIWTMCWAIRTNGR
jgi:ADP-ribose pyrophosphatase